MTDTLDPLIRDLVAWCAHAPRSHADVMDVWRTSCPRFTVWEDALARGLVARVSVPGRGAMVEVTAAGRALIGAAPLPHHKPGMSNE